MLQLAAILIVLLGVAHSVLGERYILTRLFRGELPKLFGSSEFTRNTLRFAWHLTTLLALALGAILWLLPGTPPPAQPEPRRPQPQPETPSAPSKQDPRGVTPMNARLAAGTASFAALARPMAASMRDCRNP